MEFAMTDLSMFDNLTDRPFAQQLADAIAFLADAEKAMLQETANLNLDPDNEEQWERCKELGEEIDKMKVALHNVINQHKSILFWRSHKNYEDFCSTDLNPEL